MSQTELTDQQTQCWMHIKSILVSHPIGLTIDEIRSQNWSYFIKWGKKRMNAILYHQYAHARVKKKFMVKSKETRWWATDMELAHLIPSPLNYKAHHFIIGSQQQMANTYLVNQRESIISKLVDVQDAHNTLMTSLVNDLSNIQFLVNINAKNVSLYSTHIRISIN